MSVAYNTVRKKLSLAEDVVEFNEYQSTWLLRLCRRIQEAFFTALVKVPPLRAAFLDAEPHIKYKLLKIFIQFIFGVFLGLLFYLVILVDIQLDPTSTAIITIIICLSLGIGNILSSQVRCISLLLPLRFGSRTGRTIICTLIVVYLTAGPLSNINSNMSESIRVILCQMGITFSLLKSKYELLVLPLGEALLKARGYSDEANYLIDMVNAVMKPLEHEFENDTETHQMKEKNDQRDDNVGESRRSVDVERKYAILPNDGPAEKAEKTYLKKIVYRCETMTATALDKCMRGFDNLYNTCFEHLHTIDVFNFAPRFVCGALMVKSTCNFFNLYGGDDLCRPQSVLPPGTGKTYEFLKASKRKLLSDFKDSSFSYKVVTLPPETKEMLNTMYDAGKQIINEFQEKKTVMDMFVLIVMRCTAFSFLFIVIGCNNYIFNYLNDIQEDNRYVTLYFRKIDHRRSVEGKLTLLPLKTNEKRVLSDVYEFRLTTDEKGEFLHSLTTTCLLFFLTVIFIIIDRFLYSVLDDLRTHGFIEFSQIGHHDMSLEVKGVGFVASILRSIVHNFQIKRRIKRVFNNEVCLPQPSPPGKYDFKIFLSFLLFFLLTILNALGTRKLSRYVCSIFYPKAEKKRILYLYNQHLRERITFLNYRLDIVKKDLLRRPVNQLTFFRVLRLKHPKLFGWLSYFKSARRTCLICQEVEPKKGGQSYCANINCYVYFDEQCWNFVVKRECIGCVTKATESPDK